MNEEFYDSVMSNETLEIIYSKCRYVLGKSMVTQNNLSSSYDPANGTLQK